jgi:HEPN domain-containing protein
MTPAPSPREESLAWLHRANRDLTAARLLLDGDALDEALFHCQQAAEKAIKAFLTLHQMHFQKTHDLGELAHQCLRIDPSLEALLTPAEALTQYAWRFRYPGTPYEPDRAEAESALEVAHRLTGAITIRLRDTDTSPA